MSSALKWNLPGTKPHQALIFVSAAVKPLPNAAP
jgi:hypothetical protein